MGVWDPALKRLVPELAPQFMKSYTLRAPLSTHWRIGTCAEFECDQYMFGFEVPIDTMDDLGKNQYHYLTHDKSRPWRREQTGPTSWTFTCPPGSKGLGLAHDEHRVPIGRPFLLLVQGGDFRGNPRGTPTVHHVRPEDWADDFANHQDKLATAFRRG